MSNKLKLMVKPLVIHYTTLAALFTEKEHIISVKYSKIGKNTGPCSNLPSLPYSNDGNSESDEQSLKKKEQVLYKIKLTSPPIHSCRGEVINRFKTTGEVEEVEVSGEIPHDKFNLNALFAKNENTPSVQEDIMLKTISTDDWSSSNKPRGPNKKSKLTYPNTMDDILKDIYSDKTILTAGNWDNPKQQKITSKSGVEDDNKHPIKCFSNLSGGI